MHGLINRAIEKFTCDTYGKPLWDGVMRRLDLGFEEFEAMLSYDDVVTTQVLQALADELGRPRDTVLEDIGTYLVSHPHAGGLRRLLRFSGVDFVDFLHSLDDLPARARLAVPDLNLPEVELREHTLQSYSLCIRNSGLAGVGFGHVMMGLLRAMADDYGALVLLDYKGGGSGVEIVEITLHHAAFSQASYFELGVGQ